MLKIGEVFLLEVQLGSEKRVARVGLVGLCGGVGHSGVSNLTLTQRVGLALACEWGLE